MADDLISQPLLVRGGFNWIFLIEILVAGVLGLFFLFYFNRLFATVLAYCIRAWTWHKYRAYIDISALQISLLGGRVFFKSIHYHAHNITVQVYEGHVTWRYWLRSVQEAEAFRVEDGGGTGKERSSSDEDGKSGTNEKDKPRSRSIGKAENAGGKPAKELPCRISVKVAGVEAFVYNRSPLYDAILEQTRNKSQRPPSSSGSDEKPANGAGAPSPSGNEKKKHGYFAFNISKPTAHDTADTPAVAQMSSPEDASKPELPAFLRIFPIKIECKRAAAAVGNENTTSVVVAKLEKAVGTIDAGHAGPLDLYKLLFNFDLEKINVTMKPNRDFKQLQLDAAKRILRERDAAPPPSRGFDFSFVRKARRRWEAFTSLFRRSKSVNGSLRTASMKSEAHDIGVVDGVPGQSQWHGLSRYLEDKELDEHDEWKDVEYAKASTLADIPKLNLRFYFDMPGKIPNSVSGSADSSYENDINGSTPPDYGMDFGVYGGDVTYGPWTDRQRINLQQVFFPAPYVDAVQTSPLKPGDTRQWTLFKIFVTVEEDVTLRIPTREPSKDEKWQGRAGKSKKAGGQDNDDSKRKGGHSRRYRRRKAKQGNTGIDARPYAWLDVTVKTDSTVNYVMDMFPGSDGYRNTLDLDVKGTEITSSVNHGLLWRTGSVSLDADLSQPGAWNSLRDWPFSITIDDMELFILRDHLFLIIDIVNDWSSGAPSDFYTFVPYIYNLRLLFRNFIMYLNVNDANIISDPAELDRNDFLTLEGILDASLNISMEHYRPVRNMITFEVLATEMRMRMLSPARSTLSTFVKDKSVADLPKLTLKGSFSGHIEERHGLTDTLRFDIVGTGLTLKAYGFLVRQLINVKENYFGDYMHFKTLDEFQGADEDLAVANIKTASIPKPKFINELDVILCIIAEDVTLLIPTGLYSTDEFIRAELPVANLDLRILSYYLDMGLQLSPITFHSGGLSNKNESPTDTTASTQMFVKHMDLNGHRAFGSPPDEPAYVNQWDIDVGAITGELSESFVHDLAMAGRTFVFAFEDRENALPLAPPSVFNDVTFVQVQTSTVRLWLHVGKDALLLSADPVEVITNDWAGETFSQKIGVLVPKVTLACVDGQSASRHRDRKMHMRSDRTRVKTHAFFQTGVAVDVVQRKAHFAEEKSKQQRYIRENDQRTGRASFLEYRTDGKLMPFDRDPDLHPPAMPYPSLPLPLDSLGNASRRPSSIKSVRSVNRNEVRPKASSTSLSASVRSVALPTDSRVQRLRGGRTKMRTSSQSLRSSSRARSTNTDVERSHHRLANDRERADAGLPPSTVAFSSSFAEPYFPLDMFEPDEAHVPDFGLRAQNGRTSSGGSSVSGVIEDPDVEHDAAQTSVLIRLTPGVRAYVEPHIAATVAQLLRTVSPRGLEEVMDGYQIDTVRAVATQQQKRHSTNQNLEIQVDLPSAYLRAAIPVPEKDVWDRVDLGLEYVNALVRVRKLASSTNASEVLALHVTAQGLDCSLGQFGHSPTPEPAVKASVEDMLVWIAVASSRSINASVGDAVLSVSGEQASYLTDLGLRLLPLIDELQEDIGTSIRLQRERLLLLLHTISQHSEDIGDPPFLSRMMYILRAFPDHVRNQDSWKVLVRFRHILHHLPTNSSSELQAKLGSGNLDLPDEASTPALERWAQWRNWDVPNVHQTLTFSTLFAQESTHDMTRPESKALSLAVKLDYVRLAIEAGKSVNEIVIRETSLGLDSTPPTAPTGLMLFDENTRTKTMLQTHTSSISISVNWSSIGIVERILPLIGKLQKMSVSQASEGQGGATNLSEDVLTKHIFSIVVSIGNGTISLESINLRHLSGADGIKLSLIGSTQSGEQYGLCTSAILNADAATTELHGPSHRLWHTLLVSPSLYIDHLHPLPDSSVPPSVMIAVSYRSLTIAIVEQIPGLIHLIDSVIIDEVSQIMRLIDLADTELAPTNGTQDTISNSDARLSTKIQIALLAGELHLEVSLLQALKYLLEGTAVSIRIAPNLYKDSVWGVDFDVGQQRHCFVNSSMDQRHEQSNLDVPPINGHVGIELSPDVTSLSIATTMDRIEIDAGIIQSVVTIINQAEVQEVLSSIKGDVQTMKDHIEDLKPAKAATDKHAGSATKQIAFDVRFALLGIRVAASTPRGQGRSTAQVEFGIGPLHTVASNRTTLKASRSLIPEVRAEIRDIGARLEIQDGGKTSSAGSVLFGLQLHFRSELNDAGKMARQLRVQSHALDIDAYPDTASTVVHVINHLQDRIRDLDLSKEREYIRRLRDSRRQTVVQRISGKSESTEAGDVAISAVDLLSITTTIELSNIRVAWRVDQSYARSARGRIADLVLSLDRVELATREGQEARLTLQDVQLQLAKIDTGLKLRSLNSALLSEVSFSVAYWSHGETRSFALKAAGKPLEIRLESKFMLPVDALQRSISSAIERFKAGTATWKSAPTVTGASKAQLFDTKSVSSVLVEADFAGAQFYLQGSGTHEVNLATLAAVSQQHGAQHGRYGQFAADGATMHTTLRAPGIAMKLEYNSNGQERQSTINGEVRIDASSNTLLPNVVPLVLEVSNSIKEVMQNQDTTAPAKPQPSTDTKGPQRFFEDESIVTADPTAFFGKTKVDLGLRICKQEFGLTCQPIARVDAKARLDDVYITMNTIDTDEHGHFFAISAAVTMLTAEVKHLYSREPTFSFDMESIVLSVLNSKHLSGSSGISAVLKVHPTRTFINGKQLQDLLLFREIWLPPEIRNSQSPSPAVEVPINRPEDYLVQRYHTVAAAAAFPWNATICIAELTVDIDFGQSIGKSCFTIINLWASQTKSSNSEQNLCVGLDEMAMNSTGRMSGFIRLNKLGVRTSIKWPQDVIAHRKTPLIQASVGFQRLRAKAAFDYQAFAFGDIEGFDFLMYNVHQTHGSDRDRLVAVLDCDKAFVFCTSTSPAQAYGLVQAFERLILEKQTAFTQSLRDIEKHVRRESTIVPTRFGPTIPDSPVARRSANKLEISLHTDVVLTVGAISFGVFPSTFFDSQILKLEANTIQARFAVGVERGKIHSGLGMTLGQLQVALASVRRVTAVPKALDISVDDVVSSAVNAKGGTILRVPKVVASMQTWQTLDSNNVDYIFKSLFEGKIDVGWNLSRIDFIKNMWMAHSRSLASRLGKALPESAVKITAGPAEPGKGGGRTEGQEKITAEVNLPQSKYEYNALETPIIETPQLRDMGEATPPLEWIGLHRERLPNVTHQIIIVSLLEVAKEVEDAYQKILGSS